MASLSAADAEAKISDMLQACSGHTGPNNAAAILKQSVGEIAKEVEEHKANGNRHFAEGKFEEAICKYEAASELLREYSPAALDDAVRKLLVTICSNAAQAYLKLEKWESARSKAEKALALDPANIKARFRRGCAYVGSHDWDLARTDFEAVIRLDPENESAKKELRSVLQQARSEKAAAPTPWEQAAAIAAMKDRQCKDARTEEGDEAAAAMIVQQQVERAAQLKEAALRYWDSRGAAAEWRDKLECIRSSADSMAAGVLQKAEDVEKDGGRLQDVLGPQGAALATMDTAQRRRFLEADAYVAALRQACPAEFAAIASSARGAAGSPAPPKSAQDSTAAGALDGDACRALSQVGYAVVAAVPTLSRSCLAKLRGELDAADAYGVLRKREGPPAGEFRIGVVKNAVLQSKYQGSALLEANALLRGLASEVVKRVPLPPTDARLRLSVPDGVHLFALDEGMHVGRHLGSDVEGSRVWGAVLFVNPAWEPGDGGELRILPGPAGKEVVVEPRAGSMVVFDARTTSFEITQVRRGKILAMQFWMLSAADTVH